MAVSIYTNDYLAKCHAGKWDKYCFFLNSITSQSNQQSELKSLSACGFVKRTANLSKLSLVIFQYISIDTEPDLCWPSMNIDKAFLLLFLCSRVVNKKFSEYLWQRISTKLAAHTDKFCKPDNINLDLSNIIWCKSKNKTVQQCLETSLTLTLTRYLPKTSEDI